MTLLTFQSPKASPLQAEFLESIGEPARNDYSIRVAISPHDWGRVLEERLFHVWFAEGSTPIFEAESDVYLTLCLSPGLARQLPTITYNTAKHAAWDADKGALPLHTLAWFLLSATQAIALPPELRSPEALLTVGAVTRWNALFNPAPATVPPPQEIVRVFFQEREWGYEELHPALWRLTLASGGETRVVLVHLNVEQEICSVYTVFPGNVKDEGKRASVAAYLCGLNFDLAVGNWEIDPADGEVRFRTSLDYEGGNLTAALFERLILMNLQSAVSAFQEIRSRL